MGLRSSMAEGTLEGRQCKHSRSSPGWPSSLPAGRSASSVLASRRPGKRSVASPSSQTGSRLRSQSQWLEDFRRCGFSSIARTVCQLHESQGFAQPPTFDTPCHVQCLAVKVLQKSYVSYGCLWIVTFAYLADCAHSQSLI